jgi:hypothetical protein
MGALEKCHFPKWIARKRESKEKGKEGRKEGRKNHFGAISRKGTGLTAIKSSHFSMDTSIRRRVET